MKQYRFWCESPWVGCNLEDVFDFDDDATEAVVMEEYSQWIHENFGGGFEQVEEDVDD